MDRKCLLGGMDGGGSIARLNVYSYCVWLRLTWRFAVLVSMQSLELVAISKATGTGNAWQPAADDFRGI